jgi:hypothetical protein
MFIRLIVYMMKNSGKVQIGQGHLLCVIGTSCVICCASFSGHLAAPSFALRLSFKCILVAIGQLTINDYQ